MNWIKQTKILLLAGVLAFGAASCSDSTSTEGANVQMTAEMDQSGVGSIMAIKGGAKTAANEVDSLFITRVRLLVSDLKMHQSGEDTAGGKGDKTVKTGPFLIQYDSAGSRVFTNATVPAGSYDRIKFEIHKLSSSEVGQFLNDPVFQDFVTDDRWTVIIEGYVMDEGVRSDFTYRSKQTENIQVRFNPDLSLAEGSTTQVALQFSPKAVFKKGSNLPLDPRDPANHKEMEEGIKDALKALKKG